MICIVKHGCSCIATISCITNSHVRPEAPPTHREVLDNAARATHCLARLIRAAFGH